MGKVIRHLKCWYVEGWGNLHCCLEQDSSTHQSPCTYRKLQEETSGSPRDGIQVAVNKILRTPQIAQDQHQQATMLLKSKVNCNNNFRHLSQGGRVGLLSGVGSSYQPPIKPWTKPMHGSDGRGLLLPTCCWEPDRFFRCM